MRQLFILSILLFLCSNLQAQAPTWSGDIARIIYSHCTSCHHPGGIAPNSLMTFQEVSMQTGSILSHITGATSHKMPPWPADPDYRHYVNENFLTQDEIDLIAGWILNGNPAGNLHTAPAPPEYNDSTRLGTVDLSLQMEAFTVNSNNDVYRNFIINTGLTETQYVTAIEVVPGNRDIVHHTMVFIDTSSNPIDPNTIGITGSPASKVVYVYIPGSDPYFTPPGTGFRLPANSRIILQMHYAPGSAGQTDATRVNFKLTDVPQREIFVEGPLNNITSMVNGPLFIPANETRTFHQQFSNIPIPLTFLYAMPHMHLIGRNITSYATTNTPGDTIRFVNIPEWKFHWQYNYVFQNTVIVPPGSTLRATAFYDNTTANPHNPNSPPQNVSAGTSTTDEMMGVLFAFLPYQAGDEDLIIDNRIRPQSGTNLCHGQSVWLKTIEGENYNYQWYRDGNPIAGATSSSFTAFEEGDYTVNITLGNNNLHSEAVKVNVKNLPKAEIQPSGVHFIQAGGEITLNAYSENNYTFKWYRNGTLISGATSSSFTVTEPGNYTVEVFDGCYAISEAVEVNISTNVNLTQQEIESLVKIFPNPSFGDIYIETKSDFYLQVFDTKGRLMLTETIFPNSKFIQIENPGVYVFKFTGKNGNEFTRIVSIVP